MGTLTHTVNSSRDVKRGEFVQARDLSNVQETWYGNVRIVVKLDVKRSKVEPGVWRLSFYEIFEILAQRLARGFQSVRDIGESASFTNTCMFVLVMGNSSI